MLLDGSATISPPDLNIASPLYLLLLSWYRCIYGGGESPLYLFLDSGLWKSRFSEDRGMALPHPILTFFGAPPPHPVCFCLLMILITFLYPLCLPCQTSLQMTFPPPCSIQRDGGGVDSGSSHIYLD